MKNQIRYKMRNYESFKQIEEDLRKLSLHRQIALEELKYEKQEFQNSIKPLNLLTGFFKFISKYGVLVLLKKMFR